MMDRERLLRAVEIIGSACVDPDRNEIDELVRHGYTRVDATQLVELLPEAFAIPVMEELGVSMVVDRISAKNSKGEWEEIPVNGIPIFQAALALAREHRAAGVLNRETYKAISERSALVNTASNALNAGANLSGAVMAIALINTKAEDLRSATGPGRKAWLANLWK